ncbi:MAG TPA: CS1-pili formation C-terminal domain-containing protein [Pseudomonas sp.]|uniref:CS1-pili formation C-terminal domain-containing protein n=1 Tax=Pseudomonas sp. TaxID=306 RepID=UPI002B467F2D|nr:CS1-pili formation C-terminal domain-containing protein [Pseudomonas sp.]HKS12086.1 CS1-pili formation C-terminal domain-containing protein [Pseudomonas sp.]
MNRFHPITLSLCAWLCALPAWAQTPPAALAAVAQAQGLPKEFEAHFFDVPLAVRVELDGRYLGDAMVVLSRDERVQLIEFTDTQESREPAALRKRWQARLAEGLALGDCQANCPDGLRAIHYSLTNSQLSLLTFDAEKSGPAARYHTQPEHGSYGLLLRNQLNLVGSGRDTSGRYAMQGQGSLGNWTTQADAQLDRGSDQREGTRYRLDQLYAERLVDEHFYRLGYFTPSAQGLTRQPRLLGNSPDTTLGLMLGSSDSLLIDNGQPSTTPVYVTPNRQGIAEIYRNGVLINSQPVQPGLQTLDTRVLPGGIYQVEVRLVEDGQETSRSEAFIYKPSNWSNSDSRWRYNIYAGQQTSSLSNWDNDHDDSFSGGAMFNYLLHPRAVLGASAQHVDQAMQYATSLDWDVLDRFKLYGNLNQTQGLGNGYDLQALYNHDLGSMVFSHSQSWTQPERARASRGARRPLARQREISQTSLSLSHRLTPRSTATMRLSHSTGASNGMGIDLGWTQFGKLAGSNANWQFSVFDRPGSASTGEARNRGVNLSLSMSLGTPGRRLSATVGSRTSRDGGRDHNASLAYQQDVGLGALRTLGATATLDRYGAGVGGNAQFESAVLSGDAYAQTSSYNGELSAGLNLQSMVALGDGKLAASGQYLAHEAGLIIDVESDLDAIELRADDYQGLSTALHPGRNVLPVMAYKAGLVQVDFDDKHAPPAVIQPNSFDYHLNRGGIEYRQLRVMRTVTVLGRLLDEQGKGLSGAQVINHASRSVTEADGFFAVEMSESTPVLEVRMAGQAACLLSLEPDRLTRENDLLMAGDQRCRPESLADADTSRHRSGS